MLKYIFLYKIIIRYLTKCDPEGSIEEMMETLGNRLDTTDRYVFWPNATVPFYIRPDHFDKEQTTAILTSLSMFEFKTCLKFMPVLAEPTENQHVMTFINPEGVRRCRIRTQGHSNFQPHHIQLGYDCLKTSELDMMIMRALGLPFEHNRLSRDIFIDVRKENIEPSYMELFTKDNMLPKALQAIRYDINSVMHFGERDYSKNGHKTIIFKTSNARQNKNGLSPSDLKKIQIVYGLECRKRDRAEKKALCQAYPGLGRRKREVALDSFTNMNLRVNRYITPPPEIFAAETEVKHADKPQARAKVVKDDDDGSDNGRKRLKIQNIGKITNELLDQTNQTFAKALKYARQIYCDPTTATSSDQDFKQLMAEKMNLTNISQDTIKVLEYIPTVIIKDVKKDLIEFCKNSVTFEAYQSLCERENDPRCPFVYRSSKTRTGNRSTEHKDTNDKKTADEATTSLKLNRRKREATNNISTTDSPEAAKLITSTVSTTKSPDKVEVTTSNVTTTISSEVTKTVTSSTNAPNSSIAVKSTKNDVSTPKSSTAVKELIDAVTSFKSSEAVNEVQDIVISSKASKAVKKATNTDTTLTSLEDMELKQANLKERIKTMRRDRLIEIQKVSSAAISELMANYKVKEIKTLPSRTKIKVLRKEKQKADLMAETELSKAVPKFKAHKTIFSKKIMEAIKKVIQENSSTAKPELVSSTTDSKVKKDIKDMKKYNRRLEEDAKLQTVRAYFKAYGHENKPYKRGRFSAADDSSKSNSDESSISLNAKAIQKLNEKKKPKKEIENESESSKESAETTTAKTRGKKKHKTTKPTEKTIDDSESIVSEEQSSKEKKQRWEAHRSSREPSTVQLSKLNKEFYSDRRWPHGDLIYVIKNLPGYDLEDLRERLEEVNIILRQKTCVRMREVGADVADGFEDYIILDNSSDFVTGRVGGKQGKGLFSYREGSAIDHHKLIICPGFLAMFFYTNIFGSKELFEGNHHIQHTAMMIMSMLGFYFEVARHDRDKYIRVHNRHIRPDKLHHFEKMGDEATLAIPYDYKSATHPDLWFWRKVGKKGKSTIATYKHLDLGGTVMRKLGQNPDLLSASDIIKVNSVYGIKCFRNSHS